jgi:hypothetical protein
MKYDFTAEYGPTTRRLGSVRNDEEELHIEPRQELQSESTYGNSIRYVLEHGMESGVYFTPFLC